MAMASTFQNTKGQRPHNKATTERREGALATLEIVLQVGKRALNGFRGSIGTTGVRHASFFYHSPLVPVFAPPPPPSPNNLE